MSFRKLSQLLLFTLLTCGFVSFTPTLHQLYGEVSILDQQTDLLESSATRTAAPCEALYTLQFQSFDSAGQPVVGSEFEIEALLIHFGNEITVQFPLFNFQTAGSGYLIKSLNKLPKSFRPIEDQSFLCSDNDAYLLAVDLTAAFPSPVPYFTLSVDTSGYLVIGDNNDDPIAAGGHSFNSQAITYLCKEMRKTPHSVYQGNIFTLQLQDYNYFPLPATSFSINSTVEIQKDLITLNLPAISFTITGDTSPDNSSMDLLIPGGYVNTLSGSLPENLRPQQIQTIYDSISDLNINIDTYGNLSISSPNDITAVIPVGNYTTGPVSLIYHVAAPSALNVENFIIQPSFTNFTGFSDSRALSDGIRDSHVNAILGKKVASAWTDNSAQTDKTNNIMDVYVAIGQVHHDKVVMGNPVRLTNLSLNFMAWDTAVTINPTNPDNIIVSYAILNHNTTPTTGSYNVSVSVDGGKTWTGPINIDPTVTYVGDARGVISDSYGNIYYSATTRNSTSTVLNLIFYVSSDKGMTWSTLFQTTDSSPTAGTYDYPQIAIGNNGDEQDLWFIGNFFDSNFNNINRLGFIPATGLGQFGAPSIITMDQHINQFGGGILTAKNDGTVLINNAVGGYNFLNNYYANNLIIKSPGPLEESLISQPYTILNTGQNLLPTASFPYPNYSYFSTTVNNTFYDEKRQAFYVFYSEQPDFNSQDIYLYMIASFNEGASWSRKVQVSTTPHNNRGFSSVAFDQDTGASFISFYDSRNSADSTSEQYFGAYISKKEMDKIVNELKTGSL